MATRVTPDEVRAIIDTTYDDARIQVYIDSANALVNSTIADAECHTEDSLKQVELWLSAHMVALNEQRLSSQKAGDATNVYSRPGVVLTGLESTFYGQNALLFDCSGLLATAGQTKVEIFMFGDSQGGV